MFSIDAAIATCSGYNFSSVLRPGLRLGRIDLKESSHIAVVDEMRGDNSLGGTSWALQFMKRDRALEFPGRF
ncbi:MAG: hypothetical protein SW833_20485 [Cyanobacteriota bacterium]|nr:hypothetical protein [Cyanobacteriota bacterium]